MTIAKAFGKTLKKLRIQRGFSQLELATLARLDRTFISLLERGERQPTLQTLFAVSKALSVRPGLMVSETERVFKPDHRRGQIVGGRRL